VKGAEIGPITDKKKAESDKERVGGEEGKKKKVGRTEKAWGNDEKI